MTAKLAALGVEADIFDVHGSRFYFVLVVERVFCSVRP